MKTVFLHREGAFGDHVHCSNVIRAYYEDGWEVSMCYNYKGAQIHTYNPMITHHYFFEQGAQDITHQKRKDHVKFLTKAIQEHDRFVTFQLSLESSMLPSEADPGFYYPTWFKRKKNSDICFYDRAMNWAGLTDPKYMGWTGDVFFMDDENNIVLDYLEQFKDKFVVMWAFRGSMYQKAMYPIIKDVCDEFLQRHPEAVIITTGDKFCKQWEWEHPNVIHLTGVWPFRQVLCMAQYVNLVVTPETGLGIGAGAFGTPKVMLLTAASLTNIVGNDKNDYSLQSPAWCSPCFRAVYNTTMCEQGPPRYLNGKVIDECASEYGTEKINRLPICVSFPKDMVLDQMEKVFNAKCERDWTRPKDKGPAIRVCWSKDKPRSAIDRFGLEELERSARLAPPGDIVEIGVYGGGSAWYLNKICQDQDRTLHLFDTFNGMPFADEIDMVPRGKFSPKEGKFTYKGLMEIYPDAKFYKGIYPDTLPDDLNNIAFVHVDCDQYESIKSVVETMPSRMVDGGIMYFDDYSNLPGAKKAIDEHLTDLTIIGHRAIWRKEIEL